MFSKKTVKVGNLILGGKNKVIVQSMLNKPSEDVNANILQAKELENNGCGIIRISVPNQESVRTIFELKKILKIPVVADIHFNYKMAIESIYAGADKIRINPGNIENKEYIKEIVKLCKGKNIPIRIGINSGSLPKHILAKEGNTSNALVSAALENIFYLNRLDFDNIVISVKSSDVTKTINAYKKLSKKVEYPIHLGVTEAGDFKLGIIKSAIGIGSLLVDGIGDTIRVSLTGSPLDEVKIGINILKSIGLKKGLDIVSCPTCGRTKMDIAKIVKNLRKQFENTQFENKELKISVMGCAVNGLGEAKESDFGVVCGVKEGLIFKKGEIIKKVLEKDLVNELINVILSYEK